MSTHTPALRASMARPAVASLVLASRPPVVLGHRHRRLKAGRRRRRTLTLLPVQLAASCVLLRAAAVAVAITGVLLVVYQPGATGDAVGITLTLVSIGFCALYAVLTRRLLLLDDSALSVVIAQQTAALLFAIVLATVVELAGGTGWDLAGHGRGDWAAAAASGLLYYGLGFWLFVTGLRWVPASVAGSFLPLIAVFGLAAGYPRRGTARVAAVGGSGLVLAATVAIARPQHQPVAPSPPSADTQIPEQGSVPDDRVG